MAKILNNLIFWSGLVGGAYGAFRHSDTVLRRSLSYLSTSPTARQLITALPQTQTLLHRFIAGETQLAALTTSRQLNEQGLAVTLDYLGESVQNWSAVQAGSEEIGRLISATAREKLDAYISVKPTQLGLKLHPARFYSEISSLLQLAQQHQLRLRMDMEDSSCVQGTLESYFRLRSDGFDNVGVVIQAYLYRSSADIEQLINQGAAVRLVKGAYHEPSDVAYPAKRDTDSNFLRLMQSLLSAEALERGGYPAIATHDPAMIAATLEQVQKQRLRPEQFEFQMLYGIRPDLQTKLAQEGYKVRVYLPYGQAWYPYFMRRLAERPANLAFLLSHLADQK